MDTVTQFVRAKYHAVTPAAESISFARTPPNTRPDEVASLGSDNLAMTMLIGSRFGSNTFDDTCLLLVRSNEASSFLAWLALASEGDNTTRATPGQT